MAICRRCKEFEIEENSVCSVCNFQEIGEKLLQKLAAWFFKNQYKLSRKIEHLEKDLPKACYELINILDEIDNFIILSPPKKAKSSVNKYENVLEITSRIRDVTLNKFAHSLSNINKIIYRTDIREDLLNRLDKLIKSINQ